jgi:peptidoglycan/LPS O-acetylase OafA/YrhL
MQKLPPVKYFKNLDGLRFFAALAVILGHSQHVIHQYQGFYTYAPWANKLASFGVDFFFVLSGFLITYLLLQEIERTGTVNVGAFYRRRMLRIFPLYFAVGILGILTGSFWVKQFHYLSLFGGQYIDYTYNYTDFFKNLFFLGTFSVNFQTMFGFHNPVSSFSVGHLWSIAVEEQFYLIWAPVMYFFRRYVPVVILVIIAIGLFLSLLPSRLFPSYYEFQYYFTLNRFWHFGLGAAFAWTIQYISLSQLLKQILPSTHLNLGKWIISILQICSMFIAVNYLFGTFYDKGTVFLANASVSLLIIAVAIADVSILSRFQLEHKALKYLGKISYGIYMFHLFAIYATYSLLKKIGILEQSSQFYAFLPVIATVFSVVLAALSYRFLEERFLRMKGRD